MATYIVKYYGLTLNHKEENLSPRSIEAESPVDACFAAAVTAPSTDYREWEAEVASSMTMPMYRIEDGVDPLGNPENVIITDLRNGSFMIVSLTQMACILRDGTPSNQGTFSMNIWNRPHRD